MKKFHTIALLLLFAVISAYSSTSPNTLVIKLCSGETTNYLFTDKPKLTFNGTQLVIKSDSYEVTYELQQLERYYFIKTQTDGINAPQSANDKFDFRNDLLFMTGLKSGDLVSVYTTAGQLATSVSAGSDGNAVISLTGMQSGTYIVKYGNVSTKIRKL